MMMKAMHVLGTFNGKVLIYNKVQIKSSVMKYKFSSLTGRNQSTPHAESSPNFINRNRRQIINIVGALLIISFCGYNLEVEKAWKRKESQVSEIHRELEELKERVLDPVWLITVESKIRCSDSNGLLSSELAKRVGGTN